MIDDPELVDRLLNKLDAQMPFPATTTPALSAERRRRSPNPPL